MQRISHLDRQARRKRGFNLLHSLVFALACVLFGAAAMHAQFESASVLGYVHDNAGAAVPKATVTLTNVATNVSQTTKTDNEGKYEFNSILLGDYVVSTEAQGFQSAKTESFKLVTNARQRVDVSVRPGDVSETVEVTSAAQMLETETSSQGTVIGTKQVEDLPLNGRSYADLVLLVPGARKSALENNGTSSREGSFNVNGQRSAFNNFLLDGLDNNNYGTSNQGFENENISPSPDAVNEFKVETTNYSAEYGRNPGAVINASIRRGTNQFHGRAWDFIRNDAMNAMGPFRTADGRTKKMNRNQFGGTFGMPFWKDHTFFFGDYEGVRQRYAPNGVMNSTLPTAEQRAGHFYTNNNSSNPITLVNPVTGVTYNGDIPEAAMTPFARAVLAALPLPNTGADPSQAAAYSNNYVITPLGTLRDDKGDGRVDHKFNDRWSIFGRYSEHRGYIFDPPPIPGRAGGNANGNVQISNRNVVGGVTWAMSSRTLLDARFGWSENKGGKTPIGVGDSSMLVENGITSGLPTDPSIVRDLNSQSITGFTAFGAQNSNPQFQNPTIFNPKVNLTMVRGKHSIKVGYEMQIVHTQVNDFNPSYGSDTYGGQFSRGTYAAGTSNDTQTQQARNLADFMFGNRSQYQLTTYAVVNLRQRYNFMYVQDDIKLTPNLTVNAGLRYEIVTPQWERDNKMANFDPTTNTLVQAKNGSIADRAGVNTPKTNLAPRFGFAYSANAKTAIRGGYGIVYTQWNRAGGENNLSYNGPNVVNANITQGTSAALFPSANNICDDTELQTTCFRQTQQGYAPTLVTPASFNPAIVTSRYIPKNFTTGYVQNYFLDIQQQLPGGVLFDIAYVGNKGTHLQTLADYNQATPCIGATCGSLASRRPVTTFGSIEIAAGIGSSNYNALQFKVEKRSDRGFYFMNAFTWSRVFDISSGHLEANNGDNSRVNYYNPRQDYGPGGYDQPLANTTSIVYDLPFGRGRKYGASSGALLNAILGGWQTTVVNSMTSGTPININYNLSTSNPLYVSDLVTYRPQRVAGNPRITTPKNSRVKTSSALNGYFDPSALVAPTTSSWGNVRRNSERGYSFFQTDFGLHKAFPLGSQRTNIDFRAEAFNVFNKSNYMNPNSTWAAGSTSFGSITSAYPERQLQLAAKLVF